jgi:putative transposase
MNPVRAGMVADPAQYTWSSYQINPLGGNSELSTPHSLYNALGKDAEQRQAAYRALFARQIDGQLLDDIHLAVNKGLAIGNDRFKSQIEELTGRRMLPSKVGRRTRWRKYKDS